MAQRDPSIVYIHRPHVDSAGRTALVGAVEHTQTWNGTPRTVRSHQADDTSLELDIVHKVKIGTNTMKTEFWEEIKESFAAEMECELGLEKHVRFRYVVMGTEGRELWSGDPSTKAGARQLGRGQGKTVRNWFCLGSRAHKRKTLWNAIRSRRPEMGMETKKGPLFSSLGSKEWLTASEQGHDMIKSGR